MSPDTAGHWDLSSANRHRETGTTDMKFEIANAAKISGTGQFRLDSVAILISDRP